MPSTVQAVDCSFGTDDEKRGSSTQETDELHGAEYVAKSKLKEREGVKNECGRRECRGRVRTRWSLRRREGWSLEKRGPVDAIPSRTRCTNNAPFQVVPFRTLNNTE